jgi:hypothetical protein
MAPGVAVDIPTTNNRVISLCDYFIDQRRRRFATLEVRLNGGDRNFCKDEGDAPDFCGTDPTKAMSCKAFQACLEALRLIVHGAFEWRRPIALHEIVAAIKQEQAFRWPAEDHTRYMPLH